MPKPFCRVCIRREATEGKNANNGATGLKRSGAASPPSLVLFLLSPEYLPRPLLIFGFIGVRRTQLTPDAVR